MRSHFSKRAQSVLASAQAEAKEEGLSVPRARHIMTAVLRENGGSGVALLKRTNLDLEKIRSASDRSSSPAEESAGDARQWSEILEAALSEARRFGHETAGTAHLLLGILRHGRNEVAAILRRSGLDLLQMRQLVASYNGETNGTPGACSCHRPALFAAASEWESASQAAHKLVARPELEEAILATLTRASAPHIVLFGPNGAGKRSLLRSLTRRLGHMSSPASESPIRALRLELFRLVGWQWQRAQRRLAELLKDIATPGPFLLAIDDVDAFADQAHWDAAAFCLRLVLANSAFPVAVVCESFTYERFLRQDEYLSARVTSLEVPPPCGEEALRILSAVRERLEAHHGIRIADEAVDQAFVSAAEACGTGAFQVACRVLDKATAQLRVEEAKGSDAASTHADDRLAEVRRHKEEAVRNQDYASAARLRDEEQRLRDDKLRLALSDEAGRERVVDAATVVRALDPVLVATGRLTRDREA